MRRFGQVFMHVNGGVALFLLLQSLRTGELSFATVGAVNLVIALALHRELLRR